MDIIAYTLAGLNMVEAEDLVVADLEQEADLMVAVDLETLVAVEVELDTGQVEFHILAEAVDLES